MGSRRKGRNLSIRENTTNHIPYKDKYVYNQNILKYTESHLSNNRNNIYKIHANTLSKKKNRPRSILLKMLING